MATAPDPPKVFISHASEDKAFVMDFASRLRARGVDAWLDRWEIRAGDSLVKKIFDEGIAQAKTFIIVISKYSVAKPWVREELDVAVVRKIHAVSKLIPVVIDDCPVPTCLQAMLRVRIEDRKNYEEALDEVVASIFGQTDKPPIGEQPAYARKATVTIGDLSRVDSLVLQAACELCLDDGNDLQFFATDVVGRAAKLDVPQADVGDSLAILAKRSYLKHELADNWFVTSSGFEEYLKAHRPDYEALLKKFASNAVNEDMYQSEAFAESLKVPAVLLDHIVELFEDRKWIIVDHGAAGHWEIAEGGVSPEMKRWLAA
jgi:TIR domain-containing protein